VQQSFTPRLTLAGAVFPQTGLLRDALLVLGFSALIAVSARISIPMWPVPITGQTFAVLLAAAALGRVRGVAALVAYIGEGMLGLPVFAGGANAWTVSASGATYLFGPTAGYLAGFVVAAFVTGWLAELGWDRSMWRAELAMVAGNLIIYMFGVSWLASLIGLERAVTGGLVPFLVGDIIKVVLAAHALPGTWWLLGRMRPSP